MDYVTLGSAKNSFQFLMNMLAKDERFPGFQEYVRALLQDVYQQVSFRIHTWNLEVPRVPGVCESSAPERISAGQF